ncbi:hypothetical protein PybrP1_004977 [[Pythium] brassicae (nom. inval.)]|nr:hypothetical protein PybrP1_004977 [[Pythium] brassicae (nom. inval.)]
MTAPVATEAEPPQPDTVIDVPKKERAQSSAGALRAAAQIPKLTVTWENINFNVKLRNPATKKFEEKKILQSVSGEAVPGELLVLMGPSGAGKSTLLDCISARNRECTGSILVNGKKWSKAMARHSCYVMQDDLFYANLTVLEHLTFQAELRMGRVWTKDQREEHVASIISELGLTKVTNTPIGDALASESIAHFARHGCQCPPFMNPSDYFMKQLVVMDDQPESRDRVQKLVAAWTEHAAAAATTSTSSSDGGDAQVQVVQTRQQPSMSATKDANELIEKEGDVVYAPGVVTQIGVLCKRNSLRLVRDVIGFKARIGSTLFITVMIGLIFLRLKTDQKGVQDFTGAIFFISVNQFFSSANPEFISVPLEIPLVVREHNGGLYNVVTWYFAKNLSELPSQVFFPVLFLLPCYFMVGFGDADAQVFFSFYLFIALIGSCATGLGYMVSCLAKRVDVAPILGILFILPFLLFGGLFLNSDSTPDYFIWLQQISPIKYCFHGLMRAYWGSVPHIACDPHGLTRCIATSGADVLANNSVKPGKMWFDCLLLAVINVAFRLVGGFFLWRRTDKRAGATPAE